MTNQEIENYRKLWQEVHRERKIKSFYNQGSKSIEEQISYLADNSYCNWAELENLQLLPYEERTLNKVLENRSIDKNLVSIISLRQFLCFCCQPIVDINLNINKTSYSMYVSYWPRAVLSPFKSGKPFVGRNITFQDIVDFPGIDLTAKL